MRISKTGRWRSLDNAAKIFPATSGKKDSRVFRFACELYEGALDAAAELCRQAGLSDVRIVHDLTDRPRIVRAIVTEPKQRI